MKQKIKQTGINPVLLAGIVFLAAFSVRFVNLQIIKNNPYFSHPTMDEKYHDEWAREVADGRVLDKAPFYRAPAYSLVLGLTYAVFGRGYFMPRLLGIIIGSLSCVLIFLIGMELFSRQVGVLAGLLAGFYSMFLYYDSMLLTVYLEIFFYLLTVFWLLKWIKEKSTRAVFLTGVFCGLASITRPNFIVFIPCVALIILLALPKTPIKSRLHQALLFIAGSMILILPVMLVNIIKGGDFVVIAWNGGINFFLGNNPDSNGWSATAPGLESTWWGGYNDAIVIARQALGKQHLLPSEISNYWYLRGMNFVFGKPLEWLGLMVKKIYLLLNAFELSNNQSIVGFKEFSWLLRIPVINYAMILAFSIWGIIKSGKNRKAAVVVMLLCAYALTIVIFFVCARYRVVIVPFLIIFASYAVTRLIQKIKERKYKEPVYAVLLISCLVVFFNTDFYGTHKVDHSKIHISLGNRYVESAEYTKAIAEYLKALKYNPGNIEAINAAGNSYFLMKEYGKAEFIYQSSIRRERTVDALCKLGLLKIRRNDLDSAKVYFNEAISLKPNHPEPYYYMGLYYKLIKQPAKAIEYLDSALMNNPDPQYLSSIYYILGKTYQDIGDNEKSAMFLKKSEEVKGIRKLVLE